MLDEVVVDIFMVDPSFFSVLLTGEWSSDVDDDADPVLFLIIIMFACAPLILATHTLLLSTQKNVLLFPYFAVVDY